MNSFVRYLIHFFSISVVIILIMFILQLFEGNKLHPDIIKVVIIGMLFFSFNMAFAFQTFLVEEVQVVIPFNTSSEKEKIVNNVEKILIEKSGRTVKVKEHDKLKLLSKNKYNNWLTNPIELYVKGNEVKVNIPKGYRKYLNDKTVMQ